MQADQRARELAGHFIDLSRLDERRTHMIGILTDNLREAARNDPALQNSELSEGEREELFGIVREELNVFAEELAEPLRSSMITFYVERFSKDELEELIAIYESPVFVKQFDVLPELTEQNAAIAQAQMRSVQRRLADRLEAWKNEKEN